MRKLGVNVSRWKCDTVAHPLQEDTTSCGVFAFKVGLGYVTWQKLHINMLYHILGDLWIMGSISHFQFAEHLLEGSGSLQFPTSYIDDLRREIATTIMTGSGKHFKSLNPHNGLIPPDALRQRYGSGTSWPRSPQQIGSTLINETISTGRGCGTSQQRPRSGSPCRSAIIP